MEKIVSNAASHNTTAFFSFVNHPLKFKLYLFQNLPAALLSGVRVVQASDESCTVSVPYKHFTRNPFRSTYFACLSMAAELSTGLLVMANVYGRKPTVSMLITGMEGNFLKKAKDLTVFTCSNGEEIKNAVDTAIYTRQSQTVKANSIGKNRDGEVIAEFWFTWSFKTK